MKLHKNELALYTMSVNIAIYVLAPAEIRTGSRTFSNIPIFISIKACENSIMDPIKLSNINTRGRGTSRLGSPSAHCVTDLS